MRLIRAIALLGLAAAPYSTTTVRADERESRQAILQRAQVWMPTDVATMDLVAGPPGEGAFAPGETVPCVYLARKMTGSTPKFTCRLADGDEVKVKYGGANGEVYGEVLATRLLWALGFGADAMFPVNVVCDGCPAEFGGIQRQGNESRFDPAVIERKMAGAEWPSKADSGWSWKELDDIAPDRGGAPRAHRDALKLLAVFMQHSDSKPQQQRILCLDQKPRSPETCAQPFLMINDLGLTFGRASRTNSNNMSSVNLEAWRHTPIWKDASRCIGNLPKSLTGTLDNPVISEQGRRFLAGLLGQLTDQQITDLFEVARVQLRLRNPDDLSSGFPAIDEWTAVFKQKRDEIAKSRCP